MSRIGEAIDRLSTAFGMLAGMLILGIAAVTTFEVVARYIFDNPTLWTLEISEYLFVMCGFLGAGYAMLKGRHIHVELLTALLKPKTREIHEVTTHVFISIFSVLMTYYGVIMVVQAFQWNIISPLLQFPLWIPEIAVPIGMFVLSLQVARILVSKIKVLRSGELAGELPLREVTLNNPLILTPLYLGLICLVIYLLMINTTAGLLLGLFLMLFSGVPVFAALGLWGATALFMLYGGVAQLPAISLIGFKSLHSFTLIAIAVFILSASILSSGGVGARLFDLINKWIGHVPGGVLVASIGACALFAAMCGSSTATAATIGLVAIPELRKLGYNRKLTYGALAAGGTLGVMIPPSGSAILFGAMTGVSVGALFMAGILPGLMIACIFAIYILYRCRGGRLHTAQPAFPWRERFRSFRTAIWGLLAPVIILGGIWIGAFTPTESGCIAVAYSLIVSVVFIRTMNFRSVLETLNACALTTCMILIIIVGAMIFGHVVTMAQIPQQLIDFIVRSGTGMWGFMAMSILILLILGTILEGASILLITMPIFWPAIVHYEINGIWFGVVFILNMELAMVTPPVGLNLFVIQGISRDTLGTIIRGVTPFICLLAIGLGVILYFQPLSLILPKLAGL